MNRKSFRFQLDPNARADSETSLDKVGLPKPISRGYSKDQLRTAGSDKLSSQQLEPPSMAEKAPKLPPRFDSRKTTARESEGGTLNPSVVQPSENNSPHAKNSDGLNFALVPRQPQSQPFVSQFF